MSKWQDYLNLGDIPKIRDFIQLNNDPKIFNNIEDDFEAYIHNEDVAIYIFDILRQLSIVEKLLNRATLRVICIRRFDNLFLDILDERYGLIDISDISLCNLVLNYGTFTQIQILHKKNMLMELFAEGLDPIEILLRFHYWSFISARYDQIFTFLVENYYQNRTVYLTNQNVMNIFYNQYPSIVEYIFTHKIEIDYNIAYGYALFADNMSVAERAYKIIGEFIIIPGLFKTHCLSDIGIGQYLQNYKHIITTSDYFSFIVDSYCYRHYNYKALKKNYKEIHSHITLDNLCNYLEQNELSGIYLDYILTLNPELDITYEHRVFNSLRKFASNHFTQLTRPMIRLSSLDYMCDRFYYYYQKQPANNSESYYLIVGEEPYSIEIFTTTLQHFIKNHTIEKCDHDCNICLEQITNNGIKCCVSSNFTEGHTYCQECITKWLSIDCRTCPICRDVLL